MDERWETATAVTINLLSALVLVAMLMMAVPPLRSRLTAVAGKQAYAWRYGRWMASQTPTPRWTQLLKRDDLPAEAGSG